MEFKQKKRTSTLVIILVVVAVAGILLWRHFSPATSPAKRAPSPSVTGRLPETPPNGNRTRAQSTVKGPFQQEGNPSLPVPKLIHITNFAVVGPSLNENENRILYYKKDGGDLLMSSLQDPPVEEKISNLTIIGLTAVRWSPHRDRALVFYADGDMLKAFLHIGSSSVAVLPSSVRDASWSPDGKSLAYIFSVPPDAAIATADASGKNSRTLLRTSLTDSSIRWSTSDTILLQTAPSSLAEGYLFGLSRSSSELKQLLGPLFGLTTLPSPDGKQILFSSTRGAGGSLVLSLKTISSPESVDLPFETLPDKCVFTGDSRTLYCAVPRTLPPQTLWPDSYLRGEIHTEDRIISYDVTKKTVETIFNDQSFDMENLTVSKDYNRFFFVDRADGTLWELQLK